MTSLIFGRLVLLLNGLAFVGFGLAFAVAPDTMLALIDLPIPNGGARTDLRAIYGGLEIGFGLYLLLSAARPAMVTSGLLAATLATAGLVTGRTYGLALDGLDPFNAKLLVSEALGFGLSAGALTWGRGRSEGA